LTYQEAIEYLYQLQRYGIRSSLHEMTRLAGSLGNPHQQFKSVHIAGTNGKGSTAAMMASILKACGFSVGLYTSPHLIDFTERIRINGKPIAPEMVAELTDHIRAKQDPTLSPTFFEFATAMAFLYFTQQRIDVAVVEVGMGGRLDATNLLDPLVSIITNVDYDHEGFLGNTVERIAQEKGGIIKEQTPVITAVDRPEAIRVIEEICRKRRARLTILGRDGWVDGRSSADFDFHGQKATLKHLSCPLLGQHQMVNAGVALLAVEVLGSLGINSSEKAIREGIGSVRWEGRLEVLRREPLILLDGAHNPAGARALANYLSDAKDVRKGRLIMVIGILANKNISAILSELTPLADEVILTRPEYSGAASLSALREALGNPAAAVKSMERIPEAVVYAMDRLLPQDILCITGSLFTVGAAKAFLEGKTKPAVFRG
jgi:dihydrofolate synthase / folylpolyglutamate synthase